MAFDGAAVKRPAHAPRKVRAAASGAVAALLLTFIVAAAAVAQQITIGLDTDVSWLITVGERVLAGSRLYVDIFELNPPASVLIYIPGIMLANGLGVRPELAIVALTFLLAAFSCVLSAIPMRRSWWLLPIAAFACLLLPGASFAQREHIAVLTLLPLIATSAARAEGRAVPTGVALLAGVGAGITASIKPHFLLAVLPLFLLVAWRRRSVAAISKVEAIAGASVIALYAAAVFVFFPDYVSQVVPLIGSGYLQVRFPVSNLATLPAFLLFAIAAGLTFFVERRQLRGSAAMFPLVAGGGFALAMLVQGKGYANHLYPPLALALIALGCALSGKGTDAGERRFGLIVLALAGAAGAFLFAHARTYPEVARIVEDKAPANPTLLVAGTNLAIGHPLTRWVGGRWVGTRGSLWATGTARDLLRNERDPAQRAKLEAAIDQDRRTWVSDLDRSRPDVVLVDGAEGWRWINRNPDVRAGMAPYRVVGTAEGIIVMIRPRRRRALLTRGG